jgi:hypothetical protein
MQAWLIKLLLGIALVLWAACASAQEVRLVAERLPDALPPTVVVESPSEPLGHKPDLPNTIKPVAKPTPSIIWHLVDGHWHCVANCSMYQHH